MKLVQHAVQLNSGGGGGVSVYETWRTQLQASSSWQLGADSRVEINMAYINTSVHQILFSTNWWQFTEK